MTALAEIRGGSREAQVYRWALVTTVAVLFLALGVLLSDLPRETRAMVSQGASMVFAVMAVVALTRRSRRSVGRRRRAWGLIAASVGSALVGALWILVMARSPWPDLVVYGDLALFVGLCGGAAGLLSFPSAPRRGTEGARMVLDGVVVGGSVLYIMSVSVFPQLLAASSGSVLGRTTSLLIPVVDGVLATLAILLILRVRSADRPALALLGLGVLPLAVADVAYAVLTAQDEFAFGSVIDLGWIAAYALMALAALHPTATILGNDVGPPQRASIIGPVLVFAVFFVAAVLTVSNVEARGAAVLTGVMWIGVLLAAAARQIVYVIDNKALREGLERRVEERTATLSEITARSELLLRSVGDGIYGVDRGGVVTFVNPAAEHILGYRAEDLIGQPAHDLIHAPQPNGTPYPVADCYVTKAISGEATHIEEDTYLRSDGSGVPVEVTASPLTRPDGIQGAVVVFRDMTERREVDRMKNEFLSIVSHELRTPLTAIRGSLGLLAGGAMGTLPTKADRMIAIGLQSTERLTRLINDILDIERIGAETAPMDVTDVSVEEVIDAAVTQTLVLASSARVDLRVVAAGGEVRGNADRVVQTLVNLLGNAIKFSPPDSTVEVEAVERGDEIEFRVSDHGRGVPPDKIESIFRPFDQVDSSDEREKGGTGLGLAICKSIVERLGGRIWVESPPGDGATFRFTLPRAPRGHRPAPRGGVPVGVAEGRTGAPDGPRGAADGDAPGEDLDVMHAVDRRV